MATVRQILANRRNAQLSTGPKDTETSRGNALQHGLAGAGIVLPGEEREAAQELAAFWNSSLKPINAFEVSLVDLMALESVRLDRCQQHEDALRELEALRAIDCWDDDRRLAIEHLALKLPEQPAVIARELQKSAPGCGWMIERWQALVTILKATGTWGKEQTR